MKYLILLTTIIASISCSNDVGRYKVQNTAILDTKTGKIYGPGKSVDGVLLFYKVSELTEMTEEELDLFVEEEKIDKE